MTPGPAFLTAQWLHVLGVTYAVDEARLAEYLPRGIGVRHRFGRGLRNRLEAWADPEPVVPAEDSAGYWLTHHDLGIGRGRDGAARSYDVAHPVWALHAVRSLAVDVDFAALYGPRWAFLADAEPSHVTLAAGSAIAITPAVDA